MKAKLYRYLFFYVFSAILNVSFQGVLYVYAVFKRFYFRYGDSGLSD